MTVKPTLTTLVALSAVVALGLAGCSAESGSTGGATATDTGGADASSGGAGSDAGASGAADSSGAAGQDAAAASDAAAATDAGGASGADAGQGATDAGPADAGTSDAGSMDVGTTDAGTTGAGGSSKWGPEQCKVAGSGKGFSVGQQIAALPIQDCDTGAKRDFAEVCGADATWLFVAHSHCPTCKATAQYTASVAQQFADKDVAIVHVVYIDDGQTCPSWRAKYGLDNLPNVKVYLDKTGASWNAIKTKNYTAPHAIMTKDRVITFKAHGLSSGGVASQLNKALNP